MEKRTPRAVCLKRNPWRPVSEEKGCSALENTRKAKKKQVKGAALDFDSTWTDKPGPRLLPLTGHTL